MTIAEHRDAPRKLASDRLRKGLALSLGALVTLAPPTLCAYALTQGFSGGLQHFSSDTSQVVMSVALVFVGLHGLAKCSVRYPLIGVAGLVGMRYLVEASAPALLAIGLAGVLGLAAGHALYRKLVSRATPCVTDTSLNPRCASCHAKHFCPYQPGGMADQYTPKS